MRRLILVATGVLLAFVADSLLLGAGLVVDALATPERTSVVLADLAALILASLQGEAAGHGLGLTVAAIWTALVTVCFAPICLVAVIGEAAQVRSLAWAAGATGVLSAAIPTIVRIASERSVDAPPQSTDGRLTLLLFLTGVGTGVVYWLVAGVSPREIR